MSTGTVTKPAQEKIEKPADPAKQLPALRGPRLPFYPLVEERFGIDRAQWKALVEAIFPNATSVESVVLALSYCKARKLDPFKRCVHIVGIWNSQLGGMVDSVWPGIGELRTTAFRTGEYAGRNRTEFGPDVTKKIGSVEVTFPEWAQVTVKRMVRGVVVDFAGPQVYWEETYATKSRKDDSPNEMWASRPRGQIDKCAEAAALRAAFPEEIGSDYIPEEVESRTVETTFTSQPKKTLDDLANAALEGPAAPPQVTPEAPEVTETPEADKLPIKDLIRTVKEFTGTRKELQTFVAENSNGLSDEDFAAVNDAAEARYAELK